MVSVDVQQYLKKKQLHLGRQTDRQTGRQTDRQAGRQTETQRDVMNGVTFNYAVGTKHRKSICEKFEQ